MRATSSGRSGVGTGAAGSSSAEWSRVSSTNIPDRLTRSARQSPAWASTRRRACASIVTAAAPAFDAFFFGIAAAAARTPASVRRYASRSASPTSANAERIRLGWRCSTA